MSNFLYKMTRNGQLLHPMVLKTIVIRFSSTFGQTAKAITQHQKDCETLNVPEDCKESQVREAFIKLAKKYHPDSGSPHADHEKFKLIDEAYKNLVKEFAEFRHNRHKIEGEYGLYYEQKRKSRVDRKKKEEESMDPEDVKHVTPQHRAYLSYDGIGSGTPSQRQKQYGKYRAMKAADSVLEHRMKRVQSETNTTEDSLVLSKNQEAARKIKTGIGMDRLVEDMIQESMAKGDFDNLSGRGKPLKDGTKFNPYVDYTTHKMNELLIQNGFMPEWILLEKEIEVMRQNLINKIRKERHRLDFEKEDTLSPKDQKHWERFLDSVRNEVKDLNKLILKYNLTVPSALKQKNGFLLDKEAIKALSHFSFDFKENVRREDTLKSEQSSGCKHKHESRTTFSEPGSIMNFFSKFFSLK